MSACTHNGPIKMYRKRERSDLGVWTCDGVRFKIHGLQAAGKTITEEMVKTAETVLKQQVQPKVQETDSNNELGFVIIHAGETGLTISSHWWSQGSVLCQSNFRQGYTDSQPLDTTERPVIACVWELEIIHEEQEAWRSTMMQANPDPEAYLKSR